MTNERLLSMSIPLAVAWVTGHYSHNLYSVFFFVGSYIGFGLTLNYLLGVYKINV